LEYLDKVVAGAITIVVTSLIWLVRTVFTSSKKIEMLENEIKHRTSTQVELRDSLYRLETEVKKLSDNLSEEIKDIWKSKS
jgi:predicted  nucleic acid-binding Zn-ribbon protein